MSSALKTIDDFVEDGRTLLQDEIAPYRYDDDSLVIAMNVTLLETRRLRPDLFLYRRRRPNEPEVQSFEGVDGTELQMEEQFRLPLLYGMVAHALTRDQEDIQDARAGAFMKIYEGMLLGVQATPSAAQQGGGG